MQSTMHEPVNSYNIMVHAYKLYIHTYVGNDVLTYIHTYVHV